MKILQMDIEKNLLEKKLNAKIRRLRDFWNKWKVTSVFRS